MSNTAKRLPIVFCLDVSPSMNYRIEGGKSSIELLNSAVSELISTLKQDNKTKVSAEVAFVTFSSNLEMNTKFIGIGTVTPPSLVTVEHGGTNMGAAVLESIEKIEEHKKELESTGIDFFAPFFVLVTDGNPDGNDNKKLYEEAVSVVKSHCDSRIGADEIIIPFIIGVGDRIVPETLSAFSEGFVKGYIPIRGNSGEISEKFEKAFRFIGNSSRKSVHLNASGEQIMKTIKSDMVDLMADLVSR